ncbi:hypothetical protein BDF20DRAFT_831515 [Mycotypha africana]|uniref:uncharacterized protein n=1 Tax=Mycotypha africana TaxID=64632 RepID=UPI00230118BD|nr:uncharacterized protein BDF20DRAFT_831515 [Mycotypha africana]KAI8991480.1 hypothetical protein BDF20DRAFT_831515 [Mycotypha africana]
MISTFTSLIERSSIRTTSTVGLCIGVVFGTAASFFRNNHGRFTSGSTSSITVSYMTGSAVSLMAILSIRNLLLNAPAARSSTTTATTRLTPLQHLRVLNYQTRSISSSISTEKVPLYVHNRYA